jgi:hypothetical protein
VSRFWLVELEPDLAAHSTTRTGVWCSLKGVNGIRAITDMEVVSQATLDELLLPAVQSLVKRPTSTRKRE